MVGGARSEIETDIEYLSRLLNPSTSTGTWSGSLSLQAGRLQVAPQVSGVGGAYQECNEVNCKFGRHRIRSAMLMSQI
jgi:hypothetical protein